MCDAHTKFQVIWWISILIKIYVRNEENIVTEIKLTKWEENSFIFPPNRQFVWYKCSLFHTRIASAGTFHFNVVQFTSRIQLNGLGVCVYLCACICHLIFGPFFENDSSNERRKLCKQNSRWTNSVLYGCNCHSISVLSLNSKQKACVRMCVCVCARSLTEFQE